MAARVHRPPGGVLVERTAALIEAGGNLEQSVGDLIGRDEQVQVRAVEATHLPAVSLHECRLLDVRLAESNVSRAPRQPVVGGRRLLANSLRVTLGSPLVSNSQCGPTTDSTSSRGHQVDHGANKPSGCSRERRNSSHPASDSRPGSSESRQTSRAPTAFATAGPNLPALE